MRTRLTVDRAGRVVLPKPLRDRLELEPGTPLELECYGEVITLRPLLPVPPLAKERGVWVYRTGQRLPATVTDAVLEELREGRNAPPFGPKK